MKESALTLKIRKALEARGCAAWKIHGGQYQSGVPDIVGCRPTRMKSGKELGRFFGLEVKVPTRRGRVTPQQQFNLDKITAAGGIAAVVTSVEEALEVLDLE